MRFGDSELEVFKQAVHWKRYYRSFLEPYLQGEVLEVGAGIGTTTEALLTPTATRWVCLEPDPSLVVELQKRIATLPKAERISVNRLTLSQLPVEDRFDVVLYIDVLEHILEDARELELAASRLRPGGKLVVLSPAHQLLFCEFDKHVGHYRRYDRASLRRIARSGLKEEKLFYLDSVGTLLSFGNRLLLRSSRPTDAQIRFWDTKVIPLSRFVDRWTGYHIGKSILGVWSKEGKG